MRQRSSICYSKASSLRQVQIHDKAPSVGSPKTKKKKKSIDTKLTDKEKQLRLKKRI
jgi:hypothetical protein